MVGPTERVQLGPDLESSVTYGAAGGVPSWGEDASRS